ncbi:hypothetical protein [Amycolatopsis sp. NBC_00438]|uniref:hypothetical protein n=1 Tax=Amycolatopsis sp. NBC_00438 TaxID=2903558 RepID=UPI002E1CF1C7
MTSQPERPAAAEVVHLNIRIDLTDRAVDTALLAARLTTALGAVAEVDVTTARRAPASGHSLRLVPRPLLHIESGARRAILRASRSR